MTKDNWIKAFDEQFSFIGGCIDRDTLANYLTIKKYGTEHLQDIKAFISQVEKDAIEKTKQELKGFDTGRNWYFEGDELVITRGKWVIDRYKKHEREEDL